MSSMIRKIARSTARHNMQQQDIDIFGTYAPKTAMVRNGRTGKMERRDNVQKSFFARSWRAYAHD